MQIETKISLIIGSAIVAATGLGTTLWKSGPNTSKQVNTVNVKTETESRTFDNRPLSIENLELESGQVILFNTVVTTDTVDIAINKINHLSENGKEIYVILDSPGGSVFDGVRLISYMEASKVPVNTVNIGLCASMCAHIFSHGTNRYMVNRSTLMYHLASGEVSGTMNNMKSLLNYIDTTTRKLDAYIAHRAGIEYKEFDSWVNKDLWIDAEDALAKHLGDQLATVKIKANGAMAVDIAEEFKKANTTTMPVKVNPLKAVF